jgi:hypothetical protein
MLSPLGSSSPASAASAFRQNVTPAKSSVRSSRRDLQAIEQQVYNERNTATMAKSKMVTRKQAATAEAPLTTKVASGTPYQLDPTQVERAAKALVSHMKKHAEEKDDKQAVKNLADDEDEAENKDQPIFLSVSTKKHVNNTNSLKPTKMSVYTFTMRKLCTNDATVPCPTQSSPAMFGYAFSQKTHSAHTRTWSHPMPSQLPSAKRSSRFLASTS